MSDEPVYHTAFRRLIGSRRIPARHGTWLWRGAPRPFSFSLVREAATSSRLGLLGEAFGPAMAARPKRPRGAPVSVAVLLQVVSKPRGTEGVPRRAAAGARQGAVRLVRAVRRRPPRR